MLWMHTATKLLRKTRPSGDRSESLKTEEIRVRILLSKEEIFRFVTEVVESKIKY
jgi:hypothetical protein